MRNEVEDIGQNKILPLSGVESLTCGANPPKYWTENPKTREVNKLIPNFGETDSFIQKYTFT